MISRRWAAGLILLVAGAAALRGQSPGGQGEVAFEGNYIGGSGQPFLNVTGAALRAEYFLPGVGVLACDLGSYASQNRFAVGETFLELRDAPWLGRYWTLTGGDFHALASLVEFPFTNIFNPDIEARGFQIQAAHGGTQYTFFRGDETLTAGTRVAYRLVTPQTLTGASMTRKVAEHLQTGARLMQFFTSPQGIVDNPYLFPAGRTIGLVRTLAGQALYTPIEKLKIYSEVSRPLGGPSPAVTSMLGGAAWETAAFSFKADYTREGILYLPLAGYFAGDRQGPFAEARWRPWKPVEFYGSASQYQNNLEHDSSLPVLGSLSTSAGGAALLPGNLSASLAFSTVSFNETGGGQSPVASHNQQINATLSRAIRRHTLQVTWQVIRLDPAFASEQQRSWEAGDGFQTKHFSLGGSARYQQVSGTELRNSVFVRGLAQANIGRVSAYGNVEVGNDLANQTLFSTSAYRTSVVGMAVRVAHGWNLQTEMYRNLLNLALNPESIFLLENGGALAGASPAAVSLAATRQWSFYFRLAKQFHWGAGLPAAKPGQQTVKAARLAGTVEGDVRIQALAGASAAAGIAVSLDGGRTAVSGADGHYLFANVPEGVHDVALSAVELPADFDPGAAATTRVIVQPHRTARVDFAVLPLVAIAGKVSGPEGAPLSGIVIRLAPGNRYTVTGEDGAFHFYNVREGDCVLAIDLKTLPEGGMLASAGNVPVAIRAGDPAPAVAFRFTVHSTRKPIRKVLEIQH